MMKFIKFSIVIVAITLVFGYELRDAALTTPQLIAKYGYTPETHFTTTDDGYILQLHRIKSSPKLKRFTSKTKNVVLLMHGATTTSADFIIAGPKSSLGYYLSDLGYDVWMGNYRGNRYSRNHTSISPNTSKFWRYTWDELGVNDLIATIDYILKETKHKTLSYVGYSLGTTIFFVLCSVRPEYQQKINVMQALAPVAYLYRTKNPVIRSVGYFTNTIEVKQLKRPPYDFLPNTIITRRYVKTLCASNFRSICSELVYLAFGVDRKYMDEKLLAVIAGHIPSGISNWAVAQIGQMIEKNRFGHFDFGRVENIRRYGQPNPPNYNLSNIVIPVKLIYSRNDIIMAPEDILKLRDALPNCELIEPVYKEYNHADYIIGKNVRETLYKRMVGVFRKYSRY